MWACQDIGTDWLLSTGVLNLFLPADRSTLDNFATDHPGSAVEVSSGGGGDWGSRGVEWVESADR